MRFHLTKTKPRSKKQPTRTQQTIISAFRGYYEFSPFQTLSSFIPIKPGFTRFKTFWSPSTTTKKIPGQTHHKALTDPRWHRNLTPLHYQHCNGLIQILQNRAKNHTGLHTTRQNRRTVRSFIALTLMGSGAARDTQKQEVEAALQDHLTQALQEGVLTHSRVSQPSRSNTSYTSSFLYAQAGCSVGGDRLLSIDPNTSPRRFSSPITASGEQHHPTPTLTWPSPQAFSSDVLNFELQTMLTTFSIPLAVRFTASKCPSGVYRAREGCNCLSCNNKPKYFHILLFFHCFPLTMTCLKARIILLDQINKAKSFSCVLLTWFLVV